MPLYNEGERITPNVEQTLGVLRMLGPFEIILVNDGSSGQGSAAHAIDAEVRIYDKLFARQDPNQVEEGQEFTANLNPASLEVITNAKLEPSLANAPIEARYQFERLGYFCVDPDSEPGHLVFNRTVALKDTWAKIEKKSGS